MSCEKYKNWIVEKVTGDLPAREQIRLARHLKECNDCRRELESLQQALAVTRPALTAQEPPERLDRNILAMAREHAETARQKAPFFLFRPIPGTLAAALVVIVVCGVFFARHGAPLGFYTKKAESILQQPKPMKPAEPARLLESSESPPAPEEKMDASTLHGTQDVDSEAPKDQPREQEQLKPQTMEPKKSAPKIEGNKKGFIVADEKKEMEAAVNMPAGKTVTEKRKESVQEEKRSAPEPAAPATRMYEGQGLLEGDERASGGTEFQETDKFEEQAPPAGGKRGRDKEMPSEDLQRLKTRCSLIFLLEKGVQQPEISRRVDPEYPSDARESNIQGSVKATVSIDAAGHVREISIIQSLHPSCDRAVEEALKQWLFTPATRQGQAVESKIRVTVDFMIE